MPITTIPYTVDRKACWDTFIQNSKNGTFLLQRDYMDYHEIRFQDGSLLFEDEKKQIVALLAANVENNCLISHGGLTYGGIISDSRMTQPLMLKIFQSLMVYLLQQNISEMIYKTVPRIYHKGPSDEDRYVLFLLDAVLKRSDSLTVIDKHYPMLIQKRRLRAINKARACTFSVKTFDDYSDYWTLLIDNLETKHQAAPVHTLVEMHQLVRSFPENIKGFGCYDEHDQILAGVVIYETENVAHFQYIAASQNGKKRGALDWLFYILVNEYYAKKAYIDFGISNERQGRVLNQGLIDFKEGFGGRTVIHDFYQITVNSQQCDILEQMMGHS